jgi:hypothetical protein
MHSTPHIFSPVAGVMTFGRLRPIHTNAGNLQIFIPEFLFCSRNNQITVKVRGLRRGCNFF